MNTPPCRTVPLPRTVLLSLAGAALTPAPLLALGIRVPDQDPVAIARGNAFVATADNPSALHYNPAGITELSGHRVQLGINLVSVGDTFTSPTGVEFETKDEVHALPQAYYTFTPRDLPLSFGLGVYTPFGLGLEWPDNTPFRPLSIEGQLRYLTANPVVAWRINDQLSLGAGVMANWGDVNLIQGGNPAPPVGPAQDRIEFEGDGVSVGFNVGLQWRLSERHVFGAAYRSASDLNFEGDSRTTFLAPIPAFVQDASAEFRFPQIITVGYSFRPTPRWNFEVNLDWTDWDALNTVDFELQTGTQARPFNWESSFMYMLGASYLFDGGWTVSGGYIFSENSVPEEWFNPGIPDSDRHVFSLGVSKAFERLSLAAAFQYAHGPERTIDNASVPGLLANGKYEFQSWALTFSGGYHF